MKFWISTYQLFPKGSLAHYQKIKFRKGTLLRVKFDDGLVGYADVCPFQQYGDQPYEIEVQNIIRRQFSRLTERSLHCARIDAEARAAKESLYSEIRIKNHFLISNALEFDLKRVPLLQAQRFTEFKVKVGKELRLETEMLQSLVELLAPDAKIRLDFNANLSRERFVEWLAKNLSWLKPRLDFIEDPFTYEPREWQKISQDYKIDLALDLAGDPIAAHAEGANVIVIKPAVQNPEKILRAISGAEKRFVITHYMDFPIGQMSAYVAAQQLIAAGEKRIGVCGLQHHDIYEGFTFQDLIKNDGPFIVPPEGHGLGFDHLLDKQEWQEIV
jgi:o-succinylbenzoate synthase